MRFHELLEFARTLYDWVIVDAPVVFHRASLMALSECNRAFLVTAPDLASLHLTRKAQNFLTQLGLDPERYRVVINRFSRKDGIDQGDIEKILNTRVELSIPDDVYALHRVTSLGQPLQSDCELGRSVSALAAELAGAKKKPEGGKKTVTVASPALSKA
jgi:Flp pilus assembly CpaE family ATPase